MSFQLESLSNCNNNLPSYCMQLIQCSLKIQINKCWLRWQKNKKIYVYFYLIESNLRNDFNYTLNNMKKKIVMIH